MCSLKPAWWLAVFAVIVDDPLKLVGVAPYAEDPVRFRHPSCGPVTLSIFQEGSDSVTHGMP